MKLSDLIVEYRESYIVGILFQDKDMTRLPEKMTIAAGLLWYQKNGMLLLFVTMGKDGDSLRHT